jgi:hypothetical protein
VYNTESKFFHTNTTKTNPKNNKKLTQIAGVGNSAMVKYAGNGAYFLDKIEKGMWRLEVLPDLLWVKDPFEKASLSKTVAVLQEHENDMTIDLKDLGERFFIQGINADNSLINQAENKSISITPGTYIISTNKLTADFKTNQKLGNIQLNEFATTHQKIEQTYVVHQPIKEIEKGEDLVIEAKIVSPNKINKVEVVLPSGYQKTDNYKMTKKGIFGYEVVIPKNKIYSESFDYYVVITTDKKQLTFPDHREGSPANWDFVSDESYHTKIVEKEPMIILLDVLDDSSKSFLWPRQWGAIPYKIEKTSHKDASKNYLNVYADDIDAAIPDVTFKVLVNDVIKREQHNLEQATGIVVIASSGSQKNQKVQIGLQLKNGQVFGKVIELTPEKKDIRISFDELKQVSQVLLPRPYPPFQSYFLKSTENASFDVNTIEALQISIGPEIEKENYTAPQQVLFYKIYLK